jgi:hypothetical protein
MALRPAVTACTRPFIDRHVRGYDISMLLMDHNAAYGSERSLHHLAV